MNKTGSRPLDEIRWTVARGAHANPELAMMRHAPAVRNEDGFATSAALADDPFATPL
jgi:hypothetical protein